VNLLLNVERYAVTFFEVDKRLRDAAAAMTESAGHEQTLAIAWHSRVLQWSANIHNDLRSDAVPAPRGIDDAHWMLYIPQKQPLESSTAEAQQADQDLDGSRAISCDFCTDCAKQFARLQGPVGKKIPAPRMPVFARANGMWGGPLPPDLEALTYTERRIIALARIYVSIKRVHPEGAPHNRDSNNFQPLYHEKNVIAYPQTQEYVKQVVGVTPLALARTLFVQFYGTDRNVVRRDPALQVSVQRLRAAMRWLSVNSWQWMLATKSLGLGVAADGSVELGSQVEAFLHKYTSSVGSEEPGVPASLLQCAMPMQSVHVAGHAAGPADAVDHSTQGTDHIEEDGNALPHEDDAHLGGAGVGIIDGSGESLDDPVVLWDTVMRNYKLIEEVEQAYLRAASKAESSGSQADADGAAQAKKHAEAVKAAVEALRKLTSQKAQALLRKFELLYTGEERDMVEVGHEEQLLSNFLLRFGITASCISLVAVIVLSGIAVGSSVPTPRISDNGVKSGLTVSYAVLTSPAGVSASTSLRHCIIFCFVAIRCAQCKSRLRSLILAKWNY
jgi:hypothetical protein